MSSKNKDQGASLESSSEKVTPSVSTDQDIPLEEMVAQYHPDDVDVTLDNTISDTYDTAQEILMMVDGLKRDFGSLIDVLQETSSLGSANEDDVKDMQIIIRAQDLIIRNILALPVDDDARQLISGALMGTEAWDVLETAKKRLKERELKRMKIMRGKHDDSSN